jgi:AraC family transcriptional regulator of adaptative response / DNA-3-methyladenine glycosylase II
VNTPARSHAREPLTGQTTDARDDPLFAERYRAISSRDARFDGQFIVGVHSTGIYCRPSCPAMTPRPENVSFYLTAAAAHDAGLRACKRCLPDAIPGSSQWDIRDDVAARSMRLISDGVVDREGVDGLASALGYTSRHLGRILVRELGAGPLALARAHRAQTARLLLTTTDLPVADVAFAAGFGSVRQFNDTIQAVYVTSPTEMRASSQPRHSRRATSATPSAPSGSSHATGTRHPDAGQIVPGRRESGHPAALTLRLPAREPLDTAQLFGFLAERAIPGVEEGGPDHYARALSLPHGIATLAITPSRETTGIRCEVRVSDVADLAPLVSRIRRLFDLDADSRAIDEVLLRDPALRGGVLQHPGIRVPGSADPAETLFRALIGQQVSVAGARTTLARLADALGTPLDDAYGFRRLFPTPAQLAEGAGRIIRGPATRTATVVRVAERLAAGDLHLDVGQSREELEAHLQEIPGIGPWTAGYVSMRVLGSPDVLLVQDLALRAGAVRLGLPGTPRGLAERGSAWAPWRSYAGMHLWLQARA